MLRTCVLAVLAGAFLVSFAAAPTMLSGTATGSSAFAQGERTFVLPHVFDTKSRTKQSGSTGSATIQNTKRTTKKGGGPAGLAVSDEGASGTKPTKKSAK
jgi:uncharacterized low-complexity protein